MTLGWKTRPLGEVAELQGRIGWKGLTAKEYTPKGPYFLSVHSLNYGACVDFRAAFHISQQRYDESPEIMLQVDDVLICKDGAGIGKVGIVCNLPGQSTINSSLLLIRAKPNTLPKYLYYILKSPYFQEIVKSRLEGATTPHLYQRDIAKFPVHLPPVEEQQRIVAVLDEAFAGITAAESNVHVQLHSVDQARRAFEAAAFGGDNTPRTVIRLGEIANFRNGLNYTKSSVGETVPIVGVADFENNFSVDFQSLSRVRIDGQLGAADELAEGDILMVRSNGSKRLIGRTMLIGPVQERTGYSGFVIRTRVHADEISPDYLCHYLKSSTVRAALVASGAGANISSLSQGALADLAIPVFSKRKQASIVRQLEAGQSEVDALAQIYRRKLTALAELKQSLLAHAFSGQLTREPLAA